MQQNPINQNKSLFEVLNAIKYACKPLFPFSACDSRIAIAYILKIIRPSTMTSMLYVGESFNSLSIAKTHCRKLNFKMYREMGICKDTAIAGNNGRDFFGVITDDRLENIITVSIANHLFILGRKEEEITEILRSRMLKMQQADSKPVTQKEFMRTFFLHEILRAEVIMCRQLLTKNCVATTSCSLLFDDFEIYNVMRPEESAIENHVDALAVRREKYLKAIEQGRHENIEIGEVEKFLLSALATLAVFNLYVLGTGAVFRARAGAYPGAGIYGGGAGAGVGAHPDAGVYGGGAGAGVGAYPNAGVYGDGAGAGAGAHPDTGVYGDGAGAGASAGAGAGAGAYSVATPGGLPISACNPYYATATAPSCAYASTPIALEQPSSADPSAQDLISADLFDFDSYDSAVPLDALDPPVTPAASLPLDPGAPAALVPAVPLKFTDPASVMVSAQAAAPNPVLPPVLASAPPPAAATTQKAPAVREVLEILNMLLQSARGELTDSMIKCSQDTGLFCLPLDLKSSQDYLTVLYTLHCRKTFSDDAIITSFKQLCIRNCILIHPNSADYLLQIYRQLVFITQIKEAVSQVNTEIQRKLDSAPKVGQMPKIVAEKLLQYFMIELEYQQEQDTIQQEKTAKIVLIFDEIETIDTVDRKTNSYLLKGIFDGQHIIGLSPLSITDLDLDHTGDLMGRPYLTIDDSSPIIAHLKNTSRGFEALPILFAQFDAVISLIELAQRSNKNFIIFAPRNASEIAIIRKQQIFQITAQIKFSFGIKHKELISSDGIKTLHSIKSLMRVNRQTDAAVATAQTSLCRIGKKVYDPELLTSIISHLGLDNLKLYQIEMVRLMLGTITFNNQRVINICEMGLGKTFMALATAKIFRHHQLQNGENRNRFSLVTCPKSAVSSWETDAKQLAKYRDEEVLVLNKKFIKRLSALLETPQRDAIVIVSTDTFIGLLRSPIPNPMKSCCGCVALAEFLPQQEFSAVTRLFTTQKHWKSFIKIMDKKSPSSAPTLISLKQIKDYAGQETRLSTLLEINPKAVVSLVLAKFIFDNLCREGYITSFGLILDINKFNQESYIAWILQACSDDSLKILYFQTDPVSNKLIMPLQPIIDFQTIHNLLQTRCSIMQQNITSFISDEIHILKKENAVKRTVLSWILRSTHSKIPGIVLSGTPFGNEKQMSLLLELSNPGSFGGSARAENTREINRTLIVQLANILAEHIQEHCSQNGFDPAEFEEKKQEVLKILRESVDQFDQIRDGISHCFVGLKADNPSVTATTDPACRIPSRTTSVKQWTLSTRQSGLIEGSFTATNISLACRGFDFISTDSQAGSGASCSGKEVKGLALLARYQVILDHPILAQQELGFFSQHISKSKLFQGSPSKNFEYYKEQINEIIDTEPYRGDIDRFIADSGKLKIFIDELMTILRTQGTQVLCPFRFIPTAAMLEVVLERKIKTDASISTPIKILNYRGELSDESRNETLRCINTEPGVYRVLFLSEASGGTGLSCKQITHILPYNPYHWDPAISDQAVARGIRASSTHKNIILIMLEGDNPFDKKMIAVAANKRDFANYFTAKIYTPDQCVKTDTAKWLLQRIEFYIKTHTEFNEAQRKALHDLCLYIAAQFQNPSELAALDLCQDEHEESQQKKRKTLHAGAVPKPLPLVEQKRKEIEVTKTVITHRKIQPITTSFQQTPTTAAKDAAAATSAMGAAAAAPATVDADMLVTLIDGHRMVKMSTRTPNKRPHSEHRQPLSTPSNHQPYTGQFFAGNAPEKTLPLLKPAEQPKTANVNVSHLLLKTLWCHFDNFLVFLNAHNGYEFVVPCADDAKERQSFLFSQQSLDGFSNLTKDAVVLFAAYIKFNGNEAEKKTNAKILAKLFGVNLEAIEELAGLVTKNLHIMTLAVQKMDSIVDPEEKDMFVVCKLDALIPNSNYVCIKNTSDASCRIEIQKEENLTAEEKKSLRSMVRSFFLVSRDKTTTPSLNF